MGSRFITYHECPQCGQEYEQYDAPASQMHVGVCTKCGWRDGRRYKEVRDPDGKFRLVLE